MLGQRAAFEVLKRRLSQLWNPTGDVQLIYLANDFYVIRFKAKEDRDTALTGGPWMVRGHYLAVRKWESDFQH